MTHEYFAGDQTVALDESHKIIRELCYDIISKHNVWKMNGEEELDKAFVEMRQKLPDDEYWTVKAMFAKKCSHSLVFEKDIDHELLD